MLLLLSTAAFTGCSKPPEPISGPNVSPVLAEPIAVGERQPAPTFMLKDLFTGNDVEFKTESAGRVRMVNFFSPG